MPLCVITLYTTLLHRRYLFLSCFISFPANMSDIEREWKIEFYQWKTNYMVQWQKQFDDFVKSYEDRLQSCSAP